MSNGKCLLIVESPSKAKTIAKYLGPDYIVEASMGHIRDLPKTKLGVDPDNDFEPEYVIPTGNRSTVKKLTETASKVDTVLLATDPDREGEAISWHLQTLLKLPNCENRVTFPEITKKVVLDAVDHPRKIDMNLVDAQQARRVLDRVVGYQISPVLWRKIKGGPRGLSAGRVQSAAVKLVIDRENEIRAFVPQEYWTIDLNLQRENGETYAAKYFGEEKKRELHTKEETDAILSSIENGEFKIGNIKNSPKKKNPPPPFTTSTLQQAASSSLNMSPKRTMALAQQLYEGVEVSGVGAVGLITYMRTDSVRLSDEAMGDAKRFIEEQFGTQYHYGSFHRYKTGANSQDGHEAIRPTNVFLTPERVKNDLDRDQLRLYRLIWNRFVATQMAPAVYQTLSFDSVCGTHTFRSSFQTVAFKGFTAVYDDRSDEDELTAAALSPLRENELAHAVSASSAQHFTQAPARYSEASLVKAMEEKGIGRPSTYASVISTIQDRQYVEKKDKHLVPTPVGEAVNSFLEAQFNNIVDIDFTANMETQLDEVEAGNVQWKQVLRDFYGDFSGAVGSAAAADPVRVKEETLEEPCPVCGKTLLIRNGAFGRFIGCSGYPSCTYTRSIVEPMPGRCPNCGAGLVKKKSGHGNTYYSCETSNDCFMTWDIPLDKDCPECGKTLFKLSGRGRKNPFCINPECTAFLPEDKRGYYKKAAVTGEAEKTASAKTARKSSAKKTAVGTKKTAAKKTAAKKTASKTSSKASKKN